MDTTTRMGRVAGSVATSANVAGSVSNAVFGLGTPFAYFLPTSGITYDQLTPVISFSGTTMSWTAASTAGLLVYGVY